MQSDWVRRGTLSLAAVTAIGYLLQVWSPLRLQTGVASYLTMAENGLAGSGFVNDIEPWLQPGFSVLLAGVIKAGLGVAWFFVVLNLLFLLLGLASCYRLYRTSFQFSMRDSAVLCLLMPLSFVFVRHVTVMLSDIVFFGIAMLCLALLQQAARTHDRWWLAWISTATLVATAGLFVRTVGAILLIACAWVILQRFVASRRAAMILLAVSLLAAVALASKTRYADQEAGHILVAGPRTLATYLLQRLSESGELLINVPLAKSSGPLRMLFPILGAGLLAVLAVAVWRRRATWTFLDIYGIAYLAVLSFWWANETRFWMPVMPVLLAWLRSWLSALPQTAALRMTRAAYLTWFVLMGLVALAYSTRVTFAGRDFPDVYGGGSMRDTYRAAYGLPPAANPPHVDAIRLRLLQTYDPRAKTATMGR